MSCSSFQKSVGSLVKIERIETDLPILFVGDTVKYIIRRCRIPFAFKISSSSWKPQYVQILNYYYSNDYKKKRVNKLSLITFKTFKDNHPELIKTLLEGDSIRIICHHKS